MTTAATPSPYIQQVTLAIARATLKESLLLFVYTPWQARLSKRMDDLIHAQVKCIGGDACIRLRGKTYVLSAFGSHLYSFGGRPPHRSLVPAAHQWLRDKEEIQTEERLTSHSLSSVLAATNSMDDLLDLLPSSLHPTVEAARGEFPAQAKRLSAERLLHLRTSQQQYLDLLKQRQVRLLIM